jgi:hypothetical protein
VDGALLDLAFLDFCFAAGLVLLTFAFAVLGFFPLAFVVFGFFARAFAVFVFFAFTVFFAFVFAFAVLALVDLLRRLDAAIPYPFCGPIVSGRICPFSGSTIRHGKESGP